MNNPAQAVISPAVYALPLHPGAVVSEHPDAIRISCDVVCSKAGLTWKSSIQGNVEKEGYLLLSKAVSLTLTLPCSRPHRGRGTYVHVMCPGLLAVT